MADKISATHVWDQLYKKFNKHKGLSIGQTLPILNPFRLDEIAMFFKTNAKKGDKSTIVNIIKHNIPGDRAAYTIEEVKEGGEEENQPANKRLVNESLIPKHMHANLPLQDTQLYSTRAIPCLVRKTQEQVYPMLDDGEEEEENKQDGPEVEEEQFESAVQTDPLPKYARIFKYTTKSGGHLFAIIFFDSRSSVYANRFEHCCLYWRIPLHFMVNLDKKHNRKRKNQVIRIVKELTTIMKTTIDTMTAKYKIRKCIKSHRFRELGSMVHTAIAVTAIPPMSNPSQDGNNNKPITLWLTTSLAMVPLGVTCVVFIKVSSRNDQSMSKNISIQIFKGNDQVMSRVIHTKFNTSFANQEFTCLGIFARTGNLFILAKNLRKLKKNRNNQPDDLQAEVINNYKDELGLILQSVPGVFVVVNHPDGLTVVKDSVEVYMRPVQTSAPSILGTFQINSRLATKRNLLARVPIVTVRFTRTVFRANPEGHLFTNGAHPNDYHYKPLAFASDSEFKVRTISNNCLPISAVDEQILPFFIKESQLASIAITNTTMRNDEHNEHDQKELDHEEELSLSLQVSTSITLMIMARRDAALGHTMLFLRETNEHFPKAHVWDEQSFVLRMISAVMQTSAHPLYFTIQNPNGILADYRTWGDEWGLQDPHWCVILDDHDRLEMIPANELPDDGSFYSLAKLAVEVQGMKYLSAIQHSEESEDTLFQPAPHSRKSLGTFRCLILAMMFDPNIIAEASLKLHSD